jgi:hypothetical protein
MQVRIKDIVIEIDEGDVQLINTHHWYVADGRYIVANIGGTTKTLAHILFSNLTERVRHLNGNHFDFRRCNIKIVTISENLLQKSIQSNNKKRWIA